MWPGFVLGLSSGAACLAYCAPVLMPFVLSQGRGVGRIAWVSSMFLLGRLAGYLLFAVAAWAAGAVMLKFGTQGLVVGIAYVILGALLACYGFKKPKTGCPARAVGHSPDLMRGRESMLPLVLGFLTGLNLCPPFILALTAASDTHTLWGSVSFFLMFFLGTSLYVLPTPLLGAPVRPAAVAMVGRLAAGVVAVYYFVFGIIRTTAGIQQIWLA